MLALVNNINNNSTIKKFEIILTNMFLPNFFLKMIKVKCCCLCHVRNYGELNFSKIYSVTNRTWQKEDISNVCRISHITRSDNVGIESYVNNRESSSWECKKKNTEVWKMMFLCMEMVNMKRLLKALIKKNSKVPNS